MSYAPPSWASPSLPRPTAAPLRPSSSFPMPSRASGYHGTGPQALSGRRPVPSPPHFSQMHWYPPSQRPQPPVACLPAPAPYQVVAPPSRVQTALPPPSKKRPESNLCYSLLLFAESVSILILMFGSGIAGYWLAYNSGLTMLPDPVLVWEAMSNFFAAVLA